MWYEFCRWYKCSRCIVYAIVCDTSFLPINVATTSEVFYFEYIYIYTFNAAVSDTIYIPITDICKAVSVHSSIGLSITPCKNCRDDLLTNLSSAQLTHYTKD